MMQRNTPQQSNSRNAGFSLLEVMISLGLVSITVLGLSKLLTNADAGNKSIDIRYEMSQLQQSLRARLSCAETFKIDSNTKLPLECSAFPSVTLRDAEKREILESGKFGLWTVSAKCEADNLIIGAQRPGLDPLTQKPYVIPDIFNGVSGLCAQFFERPCATPYPLLVGWSNGEARCCRAKEVTGNSGPGMLAEVQCAAHEYVRAGGGRCWWGQLGWNPPPGSNIKVANLGPVPESQPKPDANKWVYDCHTNDTAIDQYARGNAVCCPKNR